MLRLTCLTSALFSATAAVQQSSASRLVEWSQDGVKSEAKWVSQNDIDKRLNQSKTPWVNFIDLTSHNLTSPVIARPASPLPTVPTQQQTVVPLLPEVQEANLRQSIIHLSDYFTRWRDTQTGVEAAKWIGAEFRRMAEQAGRTDVEVEMWTHDGFPQESVIAKIQGTDGADAEVVVIGAHEDSIAGGGGTTRAPGADDDASGICVMLEIFRIFMRAGFKPRRTIHFVAFAAEEQGLNGSTDLVANYYLANNINVYAMVQSEMNGYDGLGYKDITVIEDGYTDNGVSSFLIRCIREYTTYNVNTATCGTCSDHVPFHNAGFRVSLVAESGPYGVLNPYIHSSRDTIDHISMAQVAQFCRLLLGFTIEAAMFQ